jgi:hypothetical protein
VSPTRPAMGEVADVDASIVRTRPDPDRETMLRMPEKLER